MSPPDHPCGHSSSLGRRTFIKGIATLGTGFAATRLFGDIKSQAVGAPPSGTPWPDPVYPFGAVYFRKTNPPEPDWARDHHTAAGLGINIFRHWFLWSAIENAPGRYDWSDYDRMVTLAAENRIKVVIAEIMTDAPEWMWDKHPRARRQNFDGTESFPSVWVSSGTGGAPLCLDDDQVLERAGGFLTALVERYRDCPAIHGYDLWNEGGTPLCFCHATQQKFRAWLKAKYGTIEALARAWHHYGVADWDSIQAPRGTNGYPDSLDWLAFRRDNGMRLLRWRTSLIRRLDRRNRITAHGVASFNENEWRMAAEVDSFGYTWVASRHGNAPWMQFHAVDLTRAASRGKTFWHAEATGGPLWLQPQVLHRPLEDGRSSDEQDVRIWCLIDMAGGAKGILFTRWRPLLDGPLFGAFGPMGMDGSVTPRAEMAGKLARWANAHPDIWKSKPVRGDLGVLFVQEALDMAAVQEAAGKATAGGQGADGSNGYARCIQGAYQGFFDSNIQADFVNIDDIGEYPLIYLPSPTRLKQSTADKLRDYVAKGGCLVSEGCPGYFGDGGTVGTIQPNLGLDQVFGAKESYVQFTPDLLEELTLEIRSAKVGGQYFLQAYTTSGGKAAGRFADGQIAAVENNFGKGKTLLIGTFPGGAYYKKRTPEMRGFFADLLPWAGVRPRINTNSKDVQVRLYEGDGGTYAWIINPTRSEQAVTVTLPRPYQRATELWRESGQMVLSGAELTATIIGRDAAVVRLE